MKNSNSWLLLYFLINKGLCFFITQMNEDEQIFTTLVDIGLNQFDNLNSCLAQGIWTRYNPLSQITQIGDFGMFDSNCYNIHNVVDEQTGFINFLYYDCVDDVSQTIKKIVQFIDDKQNQHTIQLDLDSLYYENIWFYFGISIFPKRNKVQIIILQNSNQIFFQDLDIQFPYYDQNLKVTFGGGIALKLFQRIQSYQERLIFSYFPGQMYLYQTSISDIQYYEDTTHYGMDSYVDNLQRFECSDSLLEVFSIETIKQINNEKRITENYFFYSYHFSGWIKAIEIHQTDEQFFYKLIKISSNSENNHLTNDNLSPFQLLYRFEGHKQFLQILTYSFTFPSIAIDLSQNPFLIQKEVLLTKEISLWHYLTVQFLENQLKVEFIFYDIEDQLNLNFAVDVNHFHYIKFKIQFGNILQNSLNYINFRLLQFSYAPCQILISVQGCDQNCQSCDGPTSYDCLSCKPESKRIYLPVSKSCVCPENMVDQESNCISFDNFIQSASKLLNSNISCQFGYFLFDENTCIKCPSNPYLNSQFCLECIQNPYTWKSKAICKQSLFYNQSDSLSYLLNEEQVQIPIFTFDSTTLLLCQNCQQQDLLNINDIFDNYKQDLDVSENILKYNIKNQIKYCNQLQNCFICQLKNDELICSVCEYGFILQNNFCQKINNNKYCNQPYYLNSRKQCSLCSIEYCTYCFEYLQNDLSKSTLYKNFEIFEIDEFHSVGCSLCNDGFQFNFQFGQCIFRQPNIENCLRSFINFNGEEVCTLSNLQTFGLSPEIDNCQQIIPNCKQCIKTPSQVIKCIICDDQYSASIITGKCSICPIEYSKICIQGELYEKNAWIQLVQSFIMQFLNKKYFYPKGVETFIFDYVIICQDGYKPTSQNECLPYCSSECLRCVEQADPFLGFQCLECPLNSQNQIQRSTDHTHCLKCPKLCSFCQKRSQEEIKSYNPYFQITDENVLYTYKCIQTAFKENTIIDSKLQIAKQFFGNETYFLNFYFELDCDYIYDYRYIEDFENDEIVVGNEYIRDFQSKIDLQYCNQQGIENLQITFIYRLNMLNTKRFCSKKFMTQTFNNSLKQDIFSLNFISFVLKGLNMINIENNFFNNSIEVHTFDQIQFEFMDFFLSLEMYFLFTNENLLAIKFNNIQFFSNLQPLNFKIQSTNLKYIELSNLSFQYVNFTNTIMFNMSGEQMENTIYLKNIKILDCYFLNSIFISFFQTTQEIIIQNLSIENSVFINSTIIILDADIFQNINGQLYSLELRNNQFFNSNCFKIQDYNTFEFRDISVSECYFSQSNLYSVMTLKIDLKQLNILNNYFFASSILISLQEQYVVQSNYYISNVNLDSNKFSDSFSFYITPKFNQLHQNVIIYLNNYIIQKNQAQDNQTQSFLFYIHCNEILVDDINIIDQAGISFLYIYETRNIRIRQLGFKNTLQNKQTIPLRSGCQNNFTSLQVLKVYGFINLQLENIIITRLITQDLPIIELLSNIFWNLQEIEDIVIKNLNFSQNFLLKQNLGKRLSQILIFSENRQNIIFSEINFSNNLLHQTVDDSSDTVAGLIYIKSQQSNSKIFDFISSNNWITNSSSSFLYVEIDNLFIHNYKCENLNIFNQYFLQNYISISNNFQQNSQEEIQLIIQKTLSIKTKGCACFATVRKIQIINGQFNKIFSKTSPLFEIQTQSLGLIILHDLFIFQVDVMYESNIDIQGSIKIISSSSNLDLVLSNIEFFQVYSKLGSSIISIIPSQSKNRLIFENITIKNSISLKNQIIKIEFSQENIEQNQIIFKNISVIQTEQAWIQYLQKIGQISYVDLEKIMNDNALLNFVNCKLSLQSFIVNGVFVSSIIRVVDSVDLKIINSDFSQIQIFYFLSLIQIEQNKYYSIRNLIFKNQFREIQLFNPKISNTIESTQIISIKVQEDCFFSLDNFIFSKTNFTFNQIIKLFQSQQNQYQGSLFHVQSLSNQTKISISELYLIENNCNFCNQGLVFLDIIQISNLKIAQYICLNNQIQAFGCLNIKSNQLYHNQFQIKNSIFGANYGQQGTGIFFSGLKGVIKNCLIFNNSASLDAGGIMINSENNNFIINNSLIFQNNGLKGGGLVIDKTSNINSTNFIQSFLEFNSANYLANNLIEAPTQLNLLINSQRMNSYSEISENVTESILKLENNKFNELESLINTKYLLIPSNQKIKEYQIFDYKSQVFKKYIYDISLYFQNSYQEKLGDLANQNCSVYQKILFQNGSLINQSEKFILYFNTESNQIELGDLYFTFDPYEQNNLIQQIEIFCKISDTRALSYKINTKTFFCQLGEFYSQGGCQICESNFGFYSVTYNATKCSIFDKTKFRAITSNTISLLPGFWRPNYLSDFSEQCYKDYQFCLGQWNVGDKSCLNGHIGGLCEECDFYNIRGDGYFFKNPENTDCSLCNESKSYIILFIFASFLAVFSIFVTLNSIAKTNKLFASLKIKEKFGKIIFKLNQDHSSFLLKMFLNYLWIFSIIFTYNITFSINLNVIEQASNTSYFMANNLDCFLTNISDVNLIYVRIIGTFVFILIQIILTYLFFLFFSVLKQSKFDYSNISNTFLYLYISNHASLTKQFCLLIAKRVISNISFVQGNVSLLFYSQSHQNWLYLFVLPGLNVNGCLIPLLLIFILYTKRNQLDQIRVRKHICYLFNEYNENSYYWEQIKIWQKTVIILIMTYYQDEILLKTTLLGLSFMLYQFSAIMKKPYIIQNLNKLDIETGQICSISIFLAAVRSGSTSSDQALILIQIIIIVLFLLLVYQYISVIFKAYTQKYKLMSFYYMWIFLKKISPKSTFCEYFHNLHSKEKYKKDKLRKNYEIFRLLLNQINKNFKIKQKNFKPFSVKSLENFASQEIDSETQLPLKLLIFQN